MKSWRAFLSNEGRRLSTPSLSNIRKRRAWTTLKLRWNRARTVLLPERRPRRKNFSPSSTRYPTRYPDTASEWLKFRSSPKHRKTWTANEKYPVPGGFFLSSLLLRTFRQLFAHRFPYLDSSVFRVEFEEFVGNDDAPGFAEPFVFAKGLS